MKQYRLLRDLPTFKAGQLAYISKTGNLIAGTPENQKTTSTCLKEMLQEGFDQTRKKMPMIYEVRVRVVKEGTVFVEAKTQDEAEKAATRDSVVSKPGFADTIEYYADEIYNADSTVDKSDIEIIKAEDVL